MNLPRLWIWTGIDTEAKTQSLVQRYRDLRAKGIEGIFLGGGIDNRNFEAIKEAGLALHSWMWTTNRNELELRESHPDWFMVSRSGKSCVDEPPYVDYYRWLSPFAPGVGEYLEDKASELAEHPLIEGVHLDYVRYPDVILPRALWSTYGLDQSEELSDYDFCYGPHTRRAFLQQTGRDPIEIDDPAHDQEWLHFRYRSITALVTGLKAKVSLHGKALTAAVFPTPTLARKICRQSWDQWPLDAACPMIYHSFYNESAEWIGECVLEDIQAVQFPIIAGMYMPAFKMPSEFEYALRLSRKQGAYGISLFGEVPEDFWVAVHSFESL
jgi:uncharacterized lipoprotein YddW (UPF0748 family)